MTTRAQVIVFVLAGLVFIGILLMVRRGVLKERFALIWLGIGSGVIALAAVRPWLDALSDLLGIRSGTTTLFLAATLFLLGLILHLSVSMSRMQEQIRNLAEAVALLSPRRPSAGEPASPIDGGDTGQDDSHPEA